MLLGDSFAFGWGVDDFRTAAWGLRLRNAGVPGYNTVQQYRLWKKLGKPRAYLLWNETDLVENTYGYISPGGEWDTVSREAYEQTMAAIKRYRSWPGSVQQLLGIIRRWTMTDDAVMWANTEQALKMFEAGDVTVVYLPLLRYYETRENGFGRLNEICETYGLPVIDLRSVLNRDCYFYLDGQLNRYGQEAVTMALQPYTE